LPQNGGCCRKIRPLPVNGRNAAESRSWSRSCALRRNGIFRKKFPCNGNTGQRSRITMPGNEFPGNAPENADPGTSAWGTEVEMPAGSRRSRVGLSRVEELLEARGPRAVQGAGGPGEWKNC
jgi:hypothetical protein